MKFDWRYKSKWKCEKKNDVWKTELGKLTQNFTIVDEKIPSIRSEKTGKDAEFQRNSIEHRNRSDNGKKKDDISKRKFHNFTGKTSLNQIWNDRRKWWIEGNSIEDWNRRKKTTFERQNSTNLEKFYNFSQKNSLNSI